MKQFKGYETVEKKSQICLLVVGGNKILDSGWLINHKIINIFLPFINQENSFC
jgi:hypothetical protein